MNKNLRNILFVIVALAVVGGLGYYAGVKEIKSSPSDTTVGVKISEPYISISPDYFYTIEEILYIEGRSDPNAVVTVDLRKDSGTEKPIRFQIKADSSGEWVVAEKTNLSIGDWQVKARQQVGADVSDWSNPRVIHSVVKR
jgi:hypothetical protein